MVFYPGSWLDFNYFDLFFSAIAGLFLFFGINH